MKIFIIEKWTIKNAPFLYYVAAFARGVFRRVMTHMRSCWRSALPRSARNIGGGGRSSDGPGLAEGGHM